MPRSEARPTDAVRFVFDPLCPWCYQTSRWMRRLADLGEVTIEWGVFSLELANADNPELERDKRHERSAAALRTVMAVRQHGGSDAVGDFYRELGARVHQHGEAVEEPATINGALADAGLDTGLRAKALGDEDSWDRVVAEHRALEQDSRSFGVPTILLDGGAGPAIFGPVIGRVPDSDEDAVALWRHVEWLVRYDNFAELKRDRTVKPDLPAFSR